MNHYKGLVGNRLVLLGAMLYLLEWVAILIGHVDAPLGGAASAHSVASSYAGHADALGWAAGWFAVVELGRVLLMVGLRCALAESGRPQRVMDLAVAAMVVSVAVEVVAYTVAAGAAWSLQQGGSLTVTRALDAVSFQTDQALYGPLGVSLLAAAWATWRSALFGRVLPVLALLSGTGCTVVGAALVAPRFAGAADALSSVALVFWVWMVWSGVVSWRATPSTRDVTVAASAAPSPLT